MASSGCSGEINQLQQLSGCPDDAEFMLFIAPSGFSGYSGYGLRDWATIKDCLSGTSGYSGFSGSGVSGYSGFSGSGKSGYSGESGFSGSGLSGYSGFSGISGHSGFSGFSGGNSGFSGFSGYSGGQGADGASGYSGFSGGAQGTSGYSGFSGRSGFSGLNASDSWKTVLSSAYDAVGVGASTTTYGQMTGHSTFQAEVLKQYIISEDCSVQNLFVSTSGTQPVSGNMVVMIRKNFTNTALLITIPVGSATTLWSNISTSVALVAGDILTIQFQNNATSTSQTILSTAASLIKL
jgi:hypothetical protein